MGNCGDEMVDISSGPVWVGLTLCGGFSTGSCQGNNTFVNLKNADNDLNQNPNLLSKKVDNLNRLNSKWSDLDPNQDSPVPDHFDKGNAIIRVLVQGLVEEDDPSDAAVDAIVRTEEDLPILPAVLLRVLHSDLSQPLSHTACSGCIVSDI